MEKQNKNQSFTDDLTDDEALNEELEKDLEINEESDQGNSIEDKNENNKIKYHYILFVTCRLIGIFCIE